MLALFLPAYWHLVYFDYFLARGDFEALHNRVRHYPTNNRSSLSDPVQQVCAAMDMACIWYWKEALCLQRSAATACLLRKYGVPARLVIGAQQIPFKSHAWVEVDGQVVNDKSYVSDVYAVLDRC